MPRISFNAIKDVVDNGQRLTRQQGKALLDYAIAQRDQAEQCARRAESLRIDAEGARANYERLIAEWNELVLTLDKALGVRIYSNESDADQRSLWTVEQNRKVVSKGHRSVAQAYASVLEESGRST